MQAGGWGYRIIVALSGITFILVLVYLSVSSQNRTVQAQVDQRQQFINQSIQFARIDEALVGALAAAAVNDKDDKIRHLLAQNGITINPKTGAPTPAAVSGATPGAEKPP